MALKLSNQLTGTSNQTKPPEAGERDTAQPISINCTVNALLIPYNIGLLNRMTFIYSEICI